MGNDAKAVTAVGPDPALRRMAWLFLAGAIFSSFGFAKIYGAIDKPLTHPWIPSVNSAFYGSAMGVFLVTLAGGLRQGRFWALQLAKALLAWQVISSALAIPGLIVMEKANIPVFTRFRISQILLGFGIATWLVQVAILGILWRPSLKRRVAAWDQGNGPGAGRSLTCLILCIALVELAGVHVVPLTVGQPFFGMDLTGGAAWMAQGLRIASTAGVCYLLWTGHPRAWFCALLLLLAGAVSDVFSYLVLDDAAYQGMAELAGAMDRLKINSSQLLNSKVDLWVLVLRWSLLLLLGFAGAMEEWWNVSKRIR